MAKGETRKKRKGTKAGGKQPTRAATKGGTSGGGKAVRWGAKKSTSTDRRLNWILAGLAAAAVIGGGVYWWQQNRAAHAFDALVAEGQAALQRVEESPSRGRDHLAPGASYRYAERFPTSGPHAPNPTEPGFYESSRPATRLVHALEHGNIVIYYDRPGEAALERLRAWAGLFGGQWDGVVATRKAGLGQAVVLTAWRKTLRLGSFDPAAAAAFIDAYRGRGPENPVR